jgi:hypothetical protein
VILRLAAVLSLALGIATLLAYSYVVGKGPLAGSASRHLRAMKDRTEAPRAYEPFSIAALAALPRGGSPFRYAAIESRGVSVEGYVERMLRASDGDFHLDLRGAAGPNAPYAIAELTPQWRGRSVPWSYEQLVATLRPSRGGVTPWDGGPRRVRLGGWLMYDFPHEGMRPRLGLPTPVGAWEIHPVTRIELWDDSTGGFVEYPR